MLGDKVLLDVPKGFGEISGLLSGVTSPSTHRTLSSVEEPTRSTTTRLKLRTPSTPRCLPGHRQTHLHLSRSRNPATSWRSHRLSSKPQECVLAGFSSDPSTNSLNKLSCWREEPMSRYFLFLANLG